MNMKPGFSKILQLERDLTLNKKPPKRKVRRRHFDYGLSINLSCDGIQFPALAENRIAESLSVNSDFVRPDVLQFANSDFYVEPFQYEPPAQEGSRDTSDQKDQPFVAYPPIPDHIPEETILPDVSKNIFGQTKPAGQQPMVSASGYQDSPSDDSAFEDDIKAILTGQKKYNEEQRQVVDSSTNQAGGEQYSQGSGVNDNHNNGLRSQEVANPHAIFDSLAKSFGNATSYDLGTFNLDKSFADIEETISRQEQKALEAKNRSTTVIEVQEVAPLPPLAEAPELQLSAMDLSEDYALITEDLSESTVSAHGSIDHDCETDAYNQSRPIRSTSGAMSVPPELASLLSYHNIVYNQFQPIETAYFNRLKELLVFHTIIGNNDALNATNFTEKVKDFQRRVMNQGTPDGIPGEDTLFELQKNWAGRRGLSLISTGIRNDAYQGSQIPFAMRSDVLARYNQLYDQVHNQGGIVTSAGSLRSLTAPVTPGRSTTSMHYTGLAMDLHTGSGMQATNNPYLIERSGTNGWQVYNRVADPFGASRSLNAQIYSNTGKSISPVPVNERVIDFTQIANANGFYDIGNRSCFPQDYMCAEWWHFQCEDVLVPYISQFGSELLSIYSESQLTAQPHIWQNRKKIFKKNWF
jgi:hypothetical protein